jgi:hypothetical protein
MYKFVIVKVMGLMIFTLFATHPLILAIRTILPVTFAACISFATACVVKNVPVRFTSTIFRNTSTG